MFDWAILARAATGLLGWRPDEFWHSTPVELATALRGRLGVTKVAASLSRSELEALQNHLAGH